MSYLSQLKSPKLTAHYKDTLSLIALEQGLEHIFSFSSQRLPIILCIGTDRSTGDALGPLIGTQLNKLSLPQLRIYGTLDHPVHATNLAEHVQMIRTNYRNPFILAIDACLGKLDSIGNINLVNGPLRPGSGVNKNLPEVGEVHLTGIVNVSGFMEYMVLQNTRLNLVWAMSETISKLLIKSYLKARITS